MAQDDDTPTIYALLFGSGTEAAGNVKATLTPPKSANAHGHRQLVSNQMMLIFQSSAKDFEKGAGSADTPSVASPPAPAPGTSGAPPKAPPATAVVNPLPPANSASPAAPELHDELLLTWSGPLTMRPMDAADAAKIHLVDNKDVIFQATSGVGRPVVLTDTTTDGELNMTAGKVWFQYATRTLHLDRGELPNVELMVEEYEAKLLCPAISYDQATSVVSLAGPGKFEANSGLLRKTAKTDADAPVPAGLLQGSWSKNLALSILETEDPLKPGSKTQTLRRAVVTGAVEFKDPTFQILAESLDVLLATAHTPVKGTLADETQKFETKNGIEHLLATGNVTMASIHPQATDSIKGQRIELLTSPALDPVTGKPLTSALPEPAKLLVDGAALATMYQPAKHGPEKMLKNQIATPHLAIVLGPEPKSEARLAPRVKTADPSAFSLTNMNAREIRAAQGVVLDLELDNDNHDLIHATAQDLLVDLADKNAKVSLTGDPATQQPARLARGPEYLQGMNILLDQSDNSLVIPGPGEFVGLPKEKPTAAGETTTPTPIRGTWLTQMKLDSKAGVANFTGSVKTIVLGKPDEMTQIGADTMQATFPPSLPSSADNEGGFPTAQENKKNSRIRYMGNVKALRATFDAQHKLLTGMVMSEVNDLIYDEATKSLLIPGPGMLKLEDNRPLKTDTTSTASKTNLGGAGGTRGSTQFNWDDSLVFDGAKSEIRIKGKNKDVAMVHRPAKPVQVGSNPGTSGNSSVLNGTSISEINLVGQTFVVTMDVAKPAAGEAGSDNALGMGGQVEPKVKHVLVQGSDTARATLTLDKVLLAGDKLEYDEPTKTATVSGSPRLPAHGESPERGMMNADQIIWNMSKDPTRKDSFILIRDRLSSP